MSEALRLRRRDLGETTAAVEQQACQGRIRAPKTTTGVRVVPSLPEHREHL